MTYEIGQQVETPLGVGVVVRETELKTVKVKLKDVYECLFLKRDVKPHKSAHDKLVDMGFELNDTQDYLLYYDGNRLTISIHKKSRTWVAYLGIDGLVEVDLELSRILTQYLEEMAE